MPENGTENLNLFKHSFDLFKHSVSGEFLLTPICRIATTCWEPQQVVILDDNSLPSVGDMVYSDREIIGKFGTFENSYANECKKIIAAYPPIKWVPPISTHFIQQCIDVNWEMGILAEFKFKPNKKGTPDIVLGVKLDGDGYALLELTNANNIGLRQLEPPIGDFIRAQQDINGITGNDGMYYHYADVCKMLKRHKIVMEAVNEIEAIAFTKWCKDSGWDYHEYDDKFYDLMISDKAYTGEELYELFKKEK